MQAFLVPCFCAVEVMEFSYASLCLPHPLALTKSIILFFLLGYSCVALLLVSAVQRSLF